ncbi:hypothetical protein [Cryobacterium sp. GrIS_2_6]|uniref:hypothetical protein n=1 Tax=Cryobacterium sp. GrIS_2_6 TaxID=3162785 RepID=UPI002E01BEF8|nr:hypothetical protein [Cryobacterium psychrotolerans]
MGFTVATTTVVLVTDVQGVTVHASGASAVTGADAAVSPSGEWHTAPDFALSNIIATTATSRG